MGQEARCVARVGGRTVQVKALLESEGLILRGEHRARVSFTDLDAVEAHAGTLTLHQNGEAIVLELGAAAATWAEKIRNPRTLLQKLGVKDGQRAVAIGLTDADLLGKLRASTALAEHPAVSAGLAEVGTDLDLVFVEVTERADLDALPALSRAISQAGAVWVLHPKGRADLRDVDVIASGRAAGLVDKKVARISDRLSALRFVIPRASRGQNR